MSQANSPSWAAMRFRLVHLLYVIALVATALGTFGPAGFTIAVPVLVFWGVVFSSRSRPRGVGSGCMAAVAVFCVINITFPDWQGGREVSSRLRCSSNLKQLALGLHNYHATYGSFPPAFVADENGKPMHSWRVLLLPFVEAYELYEEYDFDQPWDAPENANLMRRAPAVFRCPSADGPAMMTSYFAAVGDSAAFPAPAVRRLVEFADGSEQTILLIEDAGRAVPWTAPVDLPAEEFRAVATTGHRSHGLLFDYCAGRHIALANGGVSFIASGMPSAAWHRLLDTNDGGGDEPDYLPSPVVRTANWGNWFRLGLFACVVLSPTPWIWRRSSNGRGSPRP